MRYWCYYLWDLIYTHAWHRRIWGRKLRERHYLSAAKVREMRERLKGIDDLP
jgi:hypothetical protein